MAFWCHMVLLCYTLCVCVCPLMTYNTDLTVVADGLGKVAEEVVSVAQIATRPSLSRPII